MIQIISRIWSQSDLYLKMNRVNPLHILTIPHPLTSRQSALHSLLSLLLFLFTSSESLSHHCWILNEGLLRLVQWPQMSRALPRIWNYSLRPGSVSNPSVQEQGPSHFSQSQFQNCALLVSLRGRRHSPPIPMIWDDFLLGRDNKETHWTLRVPPHKEALKEGRNYRGYISLPPECTAEMNQRLHEMIHQPWFTKPRLQDIK